MKIQPKDEALIRRDALRAAVTKSQGGCRGCSDGYLRLAREHGATSDEVATAAAQIGGLRSATPITLGLGPESGTSRVGGGTQARTNTARRVLLPVAAAAGSLVAASRILQADAYAGMFGTDSDTEPHIQSMPTDFYIGKLGQGTTNSAGEQPLRPDFNTDSAAATNSYRTTGFWYMYGPGSRGSATPYNYGFEQGQLAVSAWSNNTYCCMENLFADVEDTTWIPGTGHTATDNANCLNGFLDAVATTAAASCYRPSSYLIPGVYFNQNQSGHSTWFPSGYAPSRSFVFWGAGGYNGYGACSMICTPCEKSCTTTLTEVIADWNGGVGKACFAGQGIVIWQFWISNCGCNGDWDYSPYTTETNPSDGAPDWGASPCG
jgi:hypothetical protein